MTSMNKTLYINDIALSDYGIYCSSDTYLNAPSIDYSEYQIPARTGTLIQYNKRLNNVLRVFSCICRKETYKQSIDDLKKLIYSNVGYVKLESDYESDVYQYGYYADELNFEIVEHEEVVMFELTFSCNPMKYFKDTATYEFHHLETEVVSAKLVNEDVVLQQLFEKIGFISDYKYFICENTWIAPIPPAEEVTFDVSLTTFQPNDFVALVAVDIDTKQISTFKFGTASQMNGSHTMKVEGEWTYVFFIANYVAGHYEVGYSHYEVVIESKELTEHTDSFDFLPVFHLVTSVRDLYTILVENKNSLSRIKLDFSSFNTDEFNEYFANYIPMDVYIDAYNMNFYVKKRGESDGAKMNIDDFITIEGDFAIEGNMLNIMKSFYDLDAIITWRKL